MLQLKMFFALKNLKYILYVMLYKISFVKHCITLAKIKNYINKEKFSCTACKSNLYYFFPVERFKLQRIQNQLKSKYCVAKLPLHFDYFLFALDLTRRIITFRAIFFFVFFLLVSLFCTQF